MWWQSALGHNSQRSWVKSPKEHFFSWLWNQISIPPLSPHFPPFPRPNPSSIHTFALFTLPFSCSSLLPPPPSSPQQPKPSSSRLTLCPCSTYLVPPAAFGGTPFPTKERRGRFPGISFHHTGKQLLNGNKSDRTLWLYLGCSLGTVVAVTDINVGKG